jgi:hypothetical protein
LPDEKKNVKLNRVKEKKTSAMEIYKSGIYPQR